MLHIFVAISNISKVKMAFQLHFTQINAGKCPVKLAGEELSRVLASFACSLIGG